MTNLGGVPILSHPFTVAPSVKTGYRSLLGETLIRGKTRH